MAKKISQLTAATSIGDADSFPIVQSGANKKATGKLVSQAYTDFTSLSGTTWDGSNKVLDLTANVALTFSPGTNRLGQLIVIQDATGSRTLSIDGNSIAITATANAVTVISFIWDLAKSKYRLFLSSPVLAITGTAPDTTAPTVSTRATGSTTTIVITLSENVTSTTAGWSFKKNGSNLAISSVSGSGTNVLTFTVATMANGDTLLCSYNSATGNCVDAASNALASFTDQSVTNGISGGLTQLSTPTLTATVISSTEIDLSWTNVSNESSYKLEWSPNGSSSWTQIGGTIAANTTSYNHTGLTGGTHYYYRLTAVGDGITYSDSNYGTDDDTTSDNGTPETVDRLDGRFTYYSAGSPWADTGAYSWIGYYYPNAYAQIDYTKGFKLVYTGNPGWLPITVVTYIDGVLTDTVAVTTDGQTIAEHHPNDGTTKTLKIGFTVGDYLSLAEIILYS